ncbi:hypothetical protein CDD82_5960 [Ophiocordyceps australis]|uniref:Alpha N-terminal protein methyltransferase 1 n=1 Tax=Ophiocordyceps australis TaxID=1399860 RepID=A0A2C5YXK4_9HYPO|nr:hypothetical protein CDD82_5960 [Ophiocordyceps australis]
MSKFTEALKDTTGVRSIFNVGLEEWQPQPGVAYDLIWTQWCSGHITDTQMVHYLEQCKAALRPASGIIVIKENLSTSGADVFDDKDSSVTRQDETYRRLFARAGLSLVRSELQRGFPVSKTLSLLPVKMYALKPQS